MGFVVCNAIYTFVGVVLILGVCWILLFDVGGVCMFVLIDGYVVLCDDVWF